MIELEEASTNSEELTSSPPPKDLPQVISKLHVGKSNQQPTKIMTVLKASFKTSTK